MQAEKETPSSDGQPFREGGKRAVGKSVLIAILLGAILTAGAYLRLRGIDWDQSRHLHPDERFLTMVLTDIEPVDSIDEFVDTASSSLNPHNRGHSFYVYGTLPLIAVRYAAEALGRTGYDQIHLVGRAFSAVADLLVVLLIFLIAWRLYDARTGLLAAAFSALAVLQIQLSHFLLVDTAANLLVTAGLYITVLLAVRRRQDSAGSMTVLVHCLLFGVALGLAGASKLNSLAAVVLLPVAFAVHRPKPLGKSLWLVAAGTATAGLAALAAFRIAQPYAFAGPGFWDVGLNQSWIDNLRSLRVMASGAVDFPPSLQWARRPVWFPWANLGVWGLGPPLALLAVGGLVWTARDMLRKRAGDEVLLWVWVIFWLVLHAFTFNCTMRYLLPICPALAVLAARTGIRLWDSGRMHRLIAPVALVATAVWALAFAQIYARPHTRVAASRWIYQNADPFAHTIANETDWDDALPLVLDNHPFPADRLGLKLDLYAPDNAGKLEHILSVLDRADLIVVSSNRQWGSITRLPERYPLTCAYYRHLLGCPDDREIASCYRCAVPGTFRGRLGFELAAVFESNPALGPWRIGDQSAEEAFTVYDHPKVLLFRKQPGYDPRAARDLLSRVDLSTVMHLRPDQFPRHPANLMLPDHRLAAQRAGGTWRTLFDPNAIVNRRPVVTIMTWYLLMCLLGLSTFPLIWLAFPGLSDRGYPMAKAAGLLLLSYPVWLAGSLGVSVDRLIIAATLAGMAATGALVAWHNRRTFGRFLRERWRYLLSVEILTAVFFVAFLLIRMANPDLWHPFRGGEKPMDLAYLTAVLKSATFPPYDPWFAGGYINYYYYGFVMVGVPVKLLGVAPAVAYNLIVPTLFALVAASAFSIGWNLVHGSGTSGQGLPIRAACTGLAAAILVTVAGNLKSVELLWQHLRTGVEAGWWYWLPSRAICHADAPPAITEFPFFTFLYGDLHAHAMALPLVLLLLGWALSQSQSESHRHPVGTYVFASLILGGLYVTNTWDFPVCATIALIAAWCGSKGRAAGVRIGIAALLIAMPFVLFSPFFHWYARGYGSFDWWTGPRTSISQYLSHWGVFLFLIGSYLLWTSVRRVREASGKPSVGFVLLIAGTLLVGLATWAAGVPIAPLALVLGIWAGTLAFTSGHSRSERFVLMLIAVAGGLTLMVEIVALQGDVGRMNTVFKFYYQAWILLAVSAAFAGVATWCASRAWRRWIRIAWRIPAVLLIGAAGLYPITATPDKISDRAAETPRGLDGAAFMAHTTCIDQGAPIRLGYDLEAIRWMREHVAGTPVLVEGHTPEYRWGSRFSIHTGLPAVVGWNWHQRQQRGSAGDLVQKRIDAVREFYTTTDAERLRTILNRYRVEYVICGELERLYYPACDERLAQFDGRLWSRVFHNEGTTIYCVNRHAPP